MHKDLPNEGPGRHPKTGQVLLNNLELNVINENGESAKLEWGAAALVSLFCMGEPVFAIDGNDATSFGTLPDWNRELIAVFTLAQPVELQKGDRLELKIACASETPKANIGCVEIHFTDMDLPELLEQGSQVTNPPDAQ